MQDLKDIRRDQIVNSKGVPYPEFRRSLSPKYAVVWRDIFIGYLALALTAGWAIIMDTQYPVVWMPLTVFSCALSFGYAHHYIQLFFHEATHYNLIRDRKINDCLANIFIGLLVGQNIKTYRPIHLMHHQHLGTPEDTEHSYFEALSPRFILESLTGIRVIKVLSNRREIPLQSISNASNEQKSSFNYMPLCGVALNGAIVLGTMALGYWSLSISWVIGLIVIFPFLGSVRQLLEHRSEYAQDAVDYSKVPHGKTNRMFGTGVIASTFGAAGFNRHFLHHWDMGISYTRLSDLEKFLLDTEVAPTLRGHQTGYFQTFGKLFARK